jgi:F-type H+-transporting ATPase subunit delta
MSELETLARPYATAVFKRAKETGSTAKWSDSLAFLALVMANPEMAKAVNDPKIGKDKLSGLLSGICEVHIDQEGTNFVNLLLQNNRMSLLSVIAKIYEGLRAEDEGFIEVEVLTAFPFTAESQRDFSEKLEKNLNKKIHMNVTVDETLIGGVLVRAGDRVIDVSILGQLQNLRKALQQ